MKWMIIWGLGIGMTWAMSGAGQSPAVVTEESAAQFRASAQVTQSKLAVQSITEEILAIDKEIERRVDKLVEMLVSVSDSVDSGRKIANQKEELMAGLKKSMEWYRQERAKRESALNARYQSLPRSELEKGVEILDEKVERRIDQILEVSASLAGHQDVAKYERYYGGWDGDDWVDGGREVSREWRHNQRVSGKTSRAQEKVMGGLKQSMEELQQENADLTRRLKTTSNPDTRASLEAQLAKNEDTLARRRDQATEAITPSAQAGRTVGSREATSLDRLMQDMVKEIQHDHRRLEGLINQRNVELQRLKRLQYR